MAKKIKLSATRINTFLSCKQKYWFAYHERLPKVSNPAFKLGLAVHESLEEAGKIWLEKEKFTKTDIKKILEFYDKISVQEGIEDLHVHKEGKELVKKRLKSFLTGRKLIGLETKFGFGGAETAIETKDGVSLIGAIDKLEEYDDDTMLLIDYKTSKTAPTIDQLRVDIQLSIYDLVARKLWPEYKRVILALDLLKSNAQFTYRTDEEREEFENYLKVVYDEMVALKAENVKATINIFCPWCDYKDYCNTYQKACKKSSYDFLPTVNYADEQLIEEWKNVRATKKILEARDRELGMIIIEKIKRKSKNLTIDDEEVYIRQNSKTAYDLDTVLKTVPDDDFHKLVGLNKKAVEKYMGMNPSVKERILETATTNYTASFLATKKIRKGKEIK